MRGARGSGSFRFAFALRERIASAAVCGLVLVCGLLVFSSPASALLQRGHEFAAALGAGKLKAPAGVAVNDETGDVYVLDSGNNRIVVYGPNHEFLQAWGAGVKTAESKTYEVCEVEAECKVGAAGYGKGQFDDPIAIAIDNSSTSPSHGDVYVVANQTATKAVIDKFSPTGELIDKLLSSKEERSEFEEERIVGVAVAPEGMVWVDREVEEEEVEVQRLGNGVKNTPIGVPTDIELEQLSGPARPGLAVDGKGGLYVTYEPGGHTYEEQLEEEEEIKEEKTHLKPQLPCERHECLVAKLKLTGTEAGEELEASIAQNPVIGENSTGVAINLSHGTQASGDVYVDNVTSVNAFTSSLALIQTFGSEHSGQLHEGKGIAVDDNTNEVFVPDASAGVVDAYRPSNPGPAVIATSSPSAAHLTSTSAELRATIDPSGANTKYRFFYGTSSCSEAGADCKEAPAKPAKPGELGDGFGDQLATAHVSELAPGTTYHILVEAEYSFEEGETTKTGTVVSEEHTFTTLSATPEPKLPDGRAWELVSPQKKHGASIEPSAREGGIVQAAAGGKAITYMSTGPLGENEPEGYRGPEASQILSTRSASGWSSRDITTPNTEGLGALPGNPREYQFFSSELDGALLNPEDSISLSKLVDEKDVYLRHDLNCAKAPDVEAPDECFEPLVTETNDTAKTFFGGSLDVLGATPDLHHVVIRAQSVKLTPGAPETGIYEWTDGELTPINFLPHGEPTTGLVFLGAGSPDGEPEGRMTLTAISHDGSRVEWHAANSPHLYSRNVPASETLQVDEVAKNAPPPTTELPALFQTASADGSKIFFTDAERLTADSKASEKQGDPDLYVFEPEKPAGERVTDLTLPLAADEHADVQGAVVGTSEDGSTVYFVADAKLSESASPGNCGQPGGSACNLYVEQDVAGTWEKPELVARLSSRDAPDWGLQDTLEGYYLQYKTSEVSPDGQYVAFMSERSLTGYDNIDVNSGARDEEVFLYHHEGTGTLACASCNPTGAQPVGVHDFQGETGEGEGLLVDRPLIWTSLLTEGETDPWLAGSVPGWTAVGLFATNSQPHYLDDSGRLFFNSPDALVPRDTNGKEDVYEYEPVGVGSCGSTNTTGGCVALISSGESDLESAFLDASTSGEDVFFLSSAPLTKRVQETGINVFDARVCEAPGSEPCAQEPPPPTTPCNSEACKAPVEGPLSYESPATATVSVSGNVHVLGSTTTKPPSKPAAKPLTKAQKLSNALKACHKIKSKKKRVSCEKTARKRYGTFKKLNAKRATARKAGLHR